MKSEQFGNPWESQPGIAVEAPVVESFLDPAQAAEVWPPEIAANEAFLEQIKDRQELNSRLDAVLDRLPRPDMALEEAIAQKHITEEQTAKLYESLSDLLEGGEDYRRIILYLPFEFLPDKDWHPSSEVLQQAKDRFEQTYMQAWKNLLSTHDTRANFVDGDIPEEKRDAGKLPKVVKAAHLIPKLVEKGLMRVIDAIDIMEQSTDELLRDSVADIFRILDDQGFMTEKDIALMKDSRDQLSNSMAAIVVAGMPKKKEVEKLSARTSAKAAQEKLTEEFCAIDTEKHPGITKKREAWLKQKGKQEVVESLGKNIAAMIEDGLFSGEEIEDFLEPEIGEPAKQAFVEGIRNAIESAATKKLEAIRLYADYEKTLDELWNSGGMDIRETLAKTYRRLFQLGIVGNQKLEQLGIIIPELAGPISKKLPLIGKELEDVKKMAAAIEADPGLSEMVYPLTLAFGSRLKGYGMQNADIDLAVFVKPETDINRQAELEERLKENFSHEKVRDKIVQFWLKKNDDSLEIHDFQNPRVYLGASYWTHLLFGAVWVGDKEKIKELREKLLAPYLHRTDKEIYGEKARYLYLKELEYDALQYRLMHKGYEKFYPPYGGIRTVHRDDIDGKSMFYDSGYRQLATRLFTRKVFLPKIEVPQQ